jgi:opacity protein-like surface antigen
MNKMMAGLAVAMTMTVLTAGRQAQAADGFLPENVYVSSAVGAHISNHLNQSATLVRLVRDWEKDKGFNGSLALGYRWGDFRFELEGSYGLLADASGTIPASLTTTPGFRVSGDVTMMTAMAGAYYDFPVTAIYQPYVGLGIGAAHVRSKSSLILIDKGTAPAGFLEAGLNMRLWDGLTFVPGYRYVQVKGDDFPDVTTHIIRLGLRAQF